MFIQLYFFFSVFHFLNPPQNWHGEKACWAWFVIIAAVESSEFWKGSEEKDWDVSVKMKTR